MTDEHATRFYLSPEAKQDLQRLHDLAQNTPRGSRARNLAAMAMNTVLAIKNGTHSTHPLEYMSSYPDLSDCETTYVGTDPNQKPSHRVVWRETPPETPGGSPLREVIALGQRQNGAVYHLAGQRLGRPTGVRLSELSTQPEPVAGPRPTTFTPSYETSPPTAEEPGLG